MIINEDDNFDIKKNFLKEMFESCIPDFDWSIYNYSYWDGDFHYNHNINEFLILDKIEGIKILVTGIDGEDEYWESDYFVFQYKENIYKMNYSEGSHGYKYILNLESLKSVKAKTKEVIYYE